MLRPNFTSQFKKDVKLAEKRGDNLELLKSVINTLVREEELLKKHRDHALAGNLKGFRECHINPDWLLIYYISGDVITFARTGSHSDLL
ncbi:MAG: type II toxin-antitoxin system YafQ family toxin [Syntrophomonas sp.]